MHDKAKSDNEIYKKRSLERNETPVQYRGRTVPKGERSYATSLSTDVTRTVNTVVKFCDVL